MFASHHLRCCWLMIGWALCNAAHAQYVETEVVVRSELSELCRKDVTRSIETSLRQAIAYMQQVGGKDASASYHLKVTYAGTGRVGSVRKLTQRGDVIDRQTGSKIGAGSEHSYVADAEHTAVFEYVLSKKTEAGLTQVQSWTVKRPVAKTQLNLGDEIVVDKERDRGEGTRGFRSKTDEAYGRWVAEQAVLRPGEVENHWYRLTDLKSKTKDGNTVIISVKVTNQTAHAVKNIKLKLATTAKYTTRQTFADGRRPVDTPVDAELGKSEEDSGPLGPGESKTVTAQIILKGVPKRGASWETGVVITGGRSYNNKTTIVTDPTIGGSAEVLAIVPQ